MDVAARTKTGTAKRYQSRDSLKSSSLASTLIKKQTLFVVSVFFPVSILFILITAIITFIIVSLRVEFVSRYGWVLMLQSWSRKSDAEYFKVRYSLGCVNTRISSCVIISFPSSRSLSEIETRMLCIEFLLLRLGSYTLVN